MAKITGFYQKVFGRLATNIGQVGSAALGTKLITSDPDTIQALAAYENGISDVTVSSKRIIPQEEFMALHYLHTLQNAYAQQEGIQEYNSDVTYFINSIVKKSGTNIVYTSKTDNNLGNALTNTTHWKEGIDLSGLSFLSSLGVFGSSGYQKIHGGFILQWGSVAVTTGSYSDITYPIAFPTNVIIPYATPQMQTSSATPICAAVDAVSVANSSTTLRIHNRSSVTATFGWISIGK